MPRSIVSFNRRRVPYQTLMVLVAWVFAHAISGWAIPGRAKADQQMPLRVSAGVRFLSPDRAELRWESNYGGAASVAYGPTRKLGTIKPSAESGTSHTVVLDGLIPGESVFYRIGIRHDDRRLMSPIYSIEPGMNYSVPTVSTESRQPSGCGQVIRELVQPGGFALIVGGLAESWARPIAEQTQMTVIAVCGDQDTLHQIRSKWYEQGVYGVRLSAQLETDLPEAIGNLVITNAKQLESAANWLSPSGVVVCLSEARPGLDAVPSGLVNWLPVEDGVWMGRLEGLESRAAWGHQYGSATNTSYAGETLGGADESEELTIRWLGRPGADFGIDRNPRMPAPLAIGGRLFHQGMNRMMALDAFNGAILWTLEMPDLRRVNIPRDSANWCADSTRIYAAVKDCLWVIDAATGEMLHTIRHPDPFADGFEWGYVAVTDEVVIGTAVKAGSAYEDYWDKPAWYDGINDATTAKVCGSSMAVYDKKYGDLRWKRDVDAVVQSTITVHDDRVYFVEADDPALRELKTGKIADDRIWSNASVVCVDLQTGDQLWKAKLPPQSSQQVVAFGIADRSGFVLETSSEGKFHLVSFDQNTGDRQWTSSVPWPSDNHGSHMQHAVLMNGQLFLQPHILDASDGSLIKTDTLGKRRGCATPIGAGGSIIYRGGAGPVSLWSLEQERPTEFSRLRPSCWLSTIPAQGMLFSPEAGGGCSCGGWMECSIGFVPVVTSAESSP